MKDLTLIKDKYGEEMMHLCRSLFPTLLEYPGLLFSLMSKNFSYSKTLYRDLKDNDLLDDFKNFIYGLADFDNEEVKTDKSLNELFALAGYDLYECHTEEEVNTFKKYYRVDEELCTFNSDRLSRCFIFFAVKKDALKIKREQFLVPKRQDEYGTSVISIQFTRGNVNTLSIKNRYNHTVDNPDATFSNNLENIIPGLTYAFKNEYGLNINQNNKGLEIPGYVKINDGKLYKYNYEINNIYYCPNNVIIDHFEVQDKYLEKEKYLIVDYFIIDLVNKRVLLYDNKICDSFISTFDNITKIEIIQLKERNKKIIITTNYAEQTIIKINEDNNIVSYENNTINEIKDKFLYYNKTLNDINITNVNEIGNAFLYNNNSIENINLPNALNIKDNFLYHNTILHDINLPKIIFIRNQFLYNNNSIENISLPNIKMISHEFLYSNKVLKQFKADQLQSIGVRFLYNNKMLKGIHLPNILKVDNDFLSHNKLLYHLDLPNLVKVGKNFLYSNELLKSIDLPSIEEVGDNFIYMNHIIIEVNLPNVITIGKSFLYFNQLLSKLILPSVITIGKSFLYFNQLLSELILPSVQEIECDFLFMNKTLKILNLPNIAYIKLGFLTMNDVIDKGEYICKLK